MGLRCAVRYPPEGEGFTCVASGPNTEDQSCSIDGGLDTCASGLICLQGACRRACDTNSAGTSCSADRLCTGVFLGTVVVGGCSPRCDPVTQRRLTDDAGMCGSLDGGMGCFGVSTNFFCSPNRFPANRTGVTPQSNFINSCAAGFTPIPTSVFPGAPVVCTPYCRPALTNSAVALQPGGVPPYTCSAAGAPGAECRFEWWFTDLSGDLGVGRCLNPATTTRVLDDGGAGPVPSCTTLSGIDTDFNGSPDYLEWGCGPP